MLLGAELLQQENNVDTAYMGVDNQAVIRATLSRASHSEHTLTDMFLQITSTALEKHDIYKLTIHWVLGHANIAGNESEGNSSAWKVLPVALRKGRGLIQLPLNKSTLIQHHSKKQKTEIRRDFLSSTHGKRLQQLDSHWSHQGSSPT